MIRLVQRKLIIPRGDTGNFSLPVSKEANTGDVAVFTIIDPRTNTKVYEKITEPVEQLITIVFTHNDTVNLPVGRYLWDVKFYVNPSFADEKLVNGDEVDSYYAAYTLPECEVRQTGDDLMTSDDSPSSTLTPESLNIITAAITEATQAKNAAAASADEAQGYVEQITGLSAEAETLPAGASATATYDAETGVLTLGLPRGDAFSVAKTYPTIAAMNADYSGSDTSVGDFVMIVSTIGDPDNAKLYVKGAERFEFVVDMSGANGVGVQSIVKSGTVENVDTYTITYTDGTTTTYNVVNGVDGDEYTVMVQDTQPTQETNKLWIPTQAGVMQEVPTVQEMNAAIAAQKIAGKVTSLNETELATDEVIEATGIPIYVDDVSAYSAYGLTDTGWYVFARIHAETGTVVTEQTAVTGAAGAILSVGADHVDVAVRFGVAAESCKVTVAWGSYTDVFVFKATDLAVRNLDYMARFYVYDISEYCTWTYELTADTAFVAGNRYFTLADGVYTEAKEGADWTAGEAIPADTYYKHSKLTLAGMTPNVTYKLNEKLDCPIEITLPEVADDGHGAWFEIQMNYSATWSCTLLPPTGIKIGTATTQAQSAGVNVIDLQYTDVDGVKIWTLLNTHSNVPA